MRNLLELNASSFTASDADVLSEDQVEFKKGLENIGSKIQFEEPAKKADDTPKKTQEASGNPLVLVGGAFALLPLGVVLSKVLGGSDKKKKE